MMGIHSDMEKRVHEKLYELEDNVDLLQQQVARQSETIAVLEAQTKMLQDILRDVAAVLQTHTDMIASCRQTGDE